MWRTRLARTEAARSIRYTRLLERGSMVRKPDGVADFLSGYPVFVRDLAVSLRATIRSTIPEAHEMLDLRGRVIGYGFGSGYADLICTIIPSKTGVKLGLVRGAELPDPQALLKGAGKRHRYVEFREASDLRRAGVKSLIRAAITLWKAKRRVSYESLHGTGPS